MAAKAPTSDAPGNYCRNCGQEVTGKIKTAAKQLSVVFCPTCGRQLDEEGRCTRKKCPRYGQKVSIL